jgi:DNA-binding XRE family transcriptional regulator
MAAKRYRLAQRRKTVGFTQETLAEQLGVDSTTVRRWESGEASPQPWIRPKLARHLQVSVDQLEDLLHASVTDDLYTAHPLVDTTAPRADRADGHSLDIQQIEQLRRGLHGVFTDGTITATLDDWESIVLSHGSAAKDRPAALLLDDLAADIAELQRTMAQCRSLSGLRRLTRVTAQLSGLMCLTLIKLDERQAFRNWSRTARIAASEADDATTHSWVLAQESYGHFYSGNLTEAVYVAQHAQAIVATAPCVGTVLAAALEARAQAALGRAEETHSALRRAEITLAALNIDAATPSAFAYNEAQLRFHESNALTHLGDTTAAWVAQDRALELVASVDFMDRAFTQLDRAMCLAIDGDTSGAATCTLDTVQGLSEPERQGIINGRARQIIAALPAGERALPLVQDLHELLMLPTETKES